MSNKPVMELWPYEHNAICEVCGRQDPEDQETDRQIYCTFCNVVYCNSCLGESDQLSSKLMECVGQEKTQWACPECWKDYVKKASKQGGAPAVGKRSRGRNRSSGGGGGKAKAPDAPTKGTEAKKAKATTNKQEAQPNTGSTKKRKRGGKR